MGGQVRLIRVIPATRTSLPALPVASPTPIATAATTPYVSEASPPAVFPLCPAFKASIQRGTSPLFRAEVKMCNAALIFPYRPIATDDVTPSVPPADRGKILSATLKT